MIILQIRNSRCLQSYKFPFISHIMCNKALPMHSPLKLILLNRTPFLTHTCQLSLDGFYSSISMSTPVLTLQDILLNLHGTSGLPWWTIIGLATLGIRSFFVFPFSVHQNQVIARLSNLNAELMKMSPELNKEVNIAAKMYGWDKTQATKVYKKSMNGYYRKFIIRDNCHPFKLVLLALFQVPVWICFSISLRNLSMFSIYTQPGLYEQLRTEGTLWFTDLTMPDMFVIPLLLAVVNLLLIEIHSLRQVGKGSKYQKWLLYFMRFMVIVVAGAATINPASVSFYWLCSGTFGLAQNVLLISPRIRRLLRIPRTANESSTPYKDIASNFRKRFLS